MTDGKAAIYVADDWLSMTVRDRERRLAGAEHLLHQPDWEEVVPGLDSLAVRFDPERTDPDTARLLFVRQLDGVAKSGASEMREQIIAVCYDAEFAPDAAMVAQKLGIELSALPAWHGAQTWTVDMLGFQPGFAYCRAEGDIPDIARLDQPRQSVPAGSVGLLGGLCGLYPFEGPGGWPLIGRTPVLLFDARRDPPNLLGAGTRVRFEAIDRARFDSLTAA
ncbi:5-oxoprolinase subunit B family protein [Novosphingopyxis sp.]|uniref:5-oxoprolinase subunit B family protein n=1 Tax=Novosphingopyxis sp. TaxID=2709690 RepID=UPI003B59C248